MAHSRINKLQAWMRKQEIEWLLVEDPTDLRYLLGFALEVGWLVISVREAHLFVDRRFIEEARHKASCKVHLRDAFSQFVSAKTLLFDSAFTTYAAFQELEKMCSFIPFDKPLKTLRAIKEPEEIKALRKAARLTYAGYEHIQTLLKEGITEEDLAFAFEIFCRKRGASRLSFSPMIAFGENSAYPHYRAGAAKLQKNQIVLMDLGCVVDGYAGDMTRVVFFGMPDPQLAQDYEVVQRAYAAACAHIRPGVVFGTLDNIAREVLKKAGCEELFIHALSHGIGLDVHEYPRLRFQGGDREVVLEAGMTFTVEPGLYRPGLGGVRYEDTILVTQEGHEKL